MGKPTADELPELKQLRELIREAHECIKEMRHLKKECEDAERRAVLALSDSYRSHMELVVKQGLESYQGELTKAINDATDRVYARFDQLGDMLLGETKKLKRRGQSLPQLIEEIIPRID
jgi:hypothetical protein